jgi:hypothetical protein
MLSYHGRIRFINGLMCRAPVIEQVRNGFDAAEDGAKPLTCTFEVELTWLN